MLAKEVLAEIPDQLVGYMKKKGFHPPGKTGSTYPSIPTNLRQYAPAAPPLQKCFRNNLLSLLQTFSLPCNASVNSFLGPQIPVSNNTYVYGIHSYEIPCNLSIPVKESCNNFLHSYIYIYTHYIYLYTSTNVYTFYIFYVTVLYCKIQKNVQFIHFG